MYEHLGNDYFKSFSIVNVAKTFTFRISLS